VAALGVAGFIGFVAIPPAAAWDQTPSVTCDRVQIDPPTWFKVTFVGTLNGTPFSRTVFYGGDGAHNAHAGIADLTAHKRTAHVVVTATSPFFGTSHTADVVLNCGNVTVAGVPVPRGQGRGPAAEEAGVAGLLPFTGAQLLTLTMLGIAMVATGLLASRARSRRERFRHDERYYSVLLPSGPWRMPERHASSHWSA
jgi:hypothetical protein